MLVRSFDDNDDDTHMTGHRWILTAVVAINALRSPLSTLLRTLGCTGPSQNEKGLFLSPGESELVNILLGSELLRLEEKEPRFVEGLKC